MSTLPVRFTRNALSNYASTLVSIVIAVAVIPVLVRGLGKEAYGIWALTMSAAVYLSLLDVGLGGATVRFVAAAWARGDREALRRVVATSAFSLTIPGALILALSPVLAALFPIVFRVPHALVDSAVVLVVLAAVEIAFAISSDTFGSTLSGLQRYDALNLTVAGAAASQAAAWTIIVALGGGLVELGIATLSISLVAQLARFALVRRYLGENVLKRRNFSRPLVGTLLRTSSWMSLDDLSETVINELDGLVVGIVAGVPQAAVYLVGQKLAGLGEGVTKPVAMLFYPHASTLAAQGDRDALRAAVYAGTRISLAAAIPVLLVLGLLAGPLLDVWVGPGYTDAAVVVVLLCGAYVLATVPVASIYAAFGQGHVRGPALLRSLEAVLNLLLSVVLGLAIGFQGVALATLISSAFVNLGLQLPYAGRRAGIPPVSLLLAAVRTHLPATGAAVAAGLVMRGFVLPAGVVGTGPRIAGLLATGATIALVYFSILVLVGLTAAERRSAADVMRLRMRRLHAAPDGADSAR